jgi:hypothetical protein
VTSAQLISVRVSFSQAVVRANLAPISAATLVLGVLLTSEPAVLAQQTTGAPGSPNDQGVIQFAQIFNGYRTAWFGKSAARVGELTDVE